MRLDQPEEVEMEKLLERRTGPVIYYSRRRLLRIAKRCPARGWEAPKGMNVLESWFG